MFACIWLLAYSGEIQPQVMMIKKVDPYASQTESGCFREVQREVDHQERQSYKRSDHRLVQQG